MPTFRGCPHLPPRGGAGCAPVVGRHLRLCSFSPRTPPSAPAPQGCASLSAARAQAQHPWAQQAPGAGLLYRPVEATVSSASVMFCSVSTQPELITKPAPGTQCHQQIFPNAVLPRPSAFQDSGG